RQVVGFRRAVQVERARGLDRFGKLVIEAHGEVRRQRRRPGGAQLREELVDAGEGGRGVVVGDADGDLHGVRGDAVAEGRGGRGKAVEDRGVPRVEAV